MSESGPTVSVLFFAALRERAGASRRQVTLPPPATVAELLARLQAEGMDVPDAASVAVNRSWAADDRRLSDGDEVALVPPVAGG